MDDAFVVRGLQGFGDLPSDGQRLFHRKRPFQRFAFHQFHDNGVAFETINGGDIRMVQRGQCLRFALKPRQVVGVIGQRGRQDFDGHVAVELGVARAVDLAHPASAQRREDFVRAESVARSERHQLRLDCTLEFRRALPVFDADCRGLTY